MYTFHPSCHARTRTPARIHDVPPIVILRLIQQCLNTWLGETPCTRIEWFFLRPHEGLGIRIAVEIFLELSPGEWVKLFEAGDGGVSVLEFGTMPDERCVDLSGAHDDAFDFVMRGNFVGLVGGIWNHPSEVGVAGEFREIRTCHRVAKKGFAEE